MRRGVWLFPGVNAQALLDAVVAAEECGLDEVWMADEGVAREPFAVLAAAAALTQRIRLAVGVTSPVLRHPGAIAAAAATLDELSGGRAVLGLGVGGHMALDPLGLSARRPVRVLSDAIDWTRAVLDGTATDYHRHADPSQHALAAWAQRPAHAIAPRPVPVWVGARGPQLVRLAARKADGVFMSGCTTEQHDRIIGSVRASDAVTGRSTRLAVYQSASDRDRRASVCRWDGVGSVLQSEIRRLHPASVGINLVDLMAPNADPAALVARSAGVLDLLS